jgi:hypothetical protein
MSLFCHCCRSRSHRHYLESPPHNSNDSDDAGSREGTFKDMDFHRFHPVFNATTPRGGYVIPLFASNFRVAERMSTVHAMNQIWDGPKSVAP